MASAAQNPTTEITSVVDHIHLEQPKVGIAPASQPPERARRALDTNITTFHTLSGQPKIISLHCKVHCF